MKPSSPPPPIVAPTAPAVTLLPANPPTTFGLVAFDSSRNPAAVVKLVPSGNLIPPLVDSITPATVSIDPGDAVPMPTPPAARMRNWLLAVEAKSRLVESAQTNAP